jgi:hypothetical protein
MQREQSFMQQDHTYSTQQEQVYSAQQDQSYANQQDQSYANQQDQSYTTQQDQSYTTQDQSYSMQQNAQQISMSHTTSQQTMTQPSPFLNTLTPHLFHTISASDDEMSETMSMADFELHPSHPNDHLSPASLRVFPP